MGGRLRFCISDSPTSAHIQRFMLAAGVPVLDGYGRAEATTAIGADRLDEFKFGFAGKVVDGVEVDMPGRAGRRLRGNKPAARGSRQGVRVPLREQERGHAPVTALDRRQGAPPNPARRFVPRRPTAVAAEDPIPRKFGPFPSAER